MNQESAGIPLLPRSTANCLDLAVMFCGRRLPAMLKLWAYLGIPICLGIALGSRFLELGLPTALGLLYLATIPFGVLLTFEATYQTFGREQGFRRLLRQYPSKLLAATGRRLFLRTLIASVPALCLFPETAVWGFWGLLAWIPACWLAVRWSFQTEQLALQALTIPGHNDGWFRTLLQQRTAELASRAIRIVVFCLLLWLVLFVTLDLATNLLLGVPILLKRLLEAGQSGSTDALAGLLVDLLWYDPRVLVALAATGLLVYPIGRLAWFFSYIDLRVRWDCWDIELQFAAQARRIAEPTR